MKKAFMRKWQVATEFGVMQTFAPSAAKARRNIEYRCVMQDRPYTRPTPRDLALMRDLTIYSCNEVGV